MRTIGRETRGLAALVIGILALAASGCVSMVGQRMTWRHDQAADRLEVLLFTDGIAVEEPQLANSKATDFEDHVDRFLDKGGVFSIFAPAGHVGLENHLDSEDGLDDMPLPRRQLLLLLERSVTVDQLGCYSDLDGRLCAAQLVTFDNVGRLLELADAALDADLVGLQEAGDQRVFEGEGVRASTGFMAEAPKTRALWYAAAVDEHRWFDLDGHAVVVRFPVDADEYEQFFAEVFAEMSRLFGPPAGGDGVVAGPAEPDDALRGRGPWSLHVERDPGRIDVELRFGASGVPALFRWYSPERAERYARLPPDGENARFRETVRGQLGETFDATLIAAIAGGGDASLESILAWVPAEERARALVVRARRDEAFRPVAEARLRELAERWDATESPVPPAGGDLAAWESWIRAVVELAPR